MRGFGRGKYLVGMVKLTNFGNKNRFTSVNEKLLKAISCSLLMSGSFGDNVVLLKETLPTKVKLRINLSGISRGLD